jgi:hypothetical protein
VVSTVSDSTSSLSTSGAIGIEFGGFALTGEGEDIRGRFFPGLTSDALNPFIGVDGMVMFSPKGLKVISFTIAPAEI